MLPGLLDGVVRTLRCSNRRVSLSNDTSCLNSRTIHAVGLDEAEHWQTSNEASSVTRLNRVLPEGFLLQAVFVLLGNR